jgi:hypothetical protein
LSVVKYFSSSVWNLMGLVWNLSGKAFCRYVLTLLTTFPGPMLPVGDVLLIRLVPLNLAQTVL